jgi:large subunit ribosomal protein L13
MKTYSPSATELEHRWYVVDAEGQVLGRLAATVAQVIRGKHKATFTPHLDGGDYVVVINAEKVRLSGRKPEQKRYFRHSGYMGHEKFTSASDMLVHHPERVIERAVFGMLPKGTLGRQVLRRKLRVYAGAEHPHQGQNPTLIAVR